MAARTQALRFAGGMVVTTALLTALSGQASASATPEPTPPPARTTPSPDEPPGPSPAPTPTVVAPDPSAPPAPAAPRPTDRRQVRAVPVGAPETGGGSTAVDPAGAEAADPWFALGGLGVAGAAAGAVVVRRRAQRG